jgi:hypothetical protein
MTPVDPLAALEQRLDAALRVYETGAGRGWAEVENLLTEAYGRLLSLEAIGIRLERQLSEPEPPAGDEARAEERRDLELFRRALLADVTRLRQSLGRYKARCLAAQARFDLEADRRFGREAEGRLRRSA